jgi:hypothetical protein
MERAQQVIMVEEVPPVPRRKTAKKSDGSVLLKQKQGLEVSPNSLVVDNSYPRDSAEESLKSVKAAAYQVNVGERRSWPKDKYYAIYRQSPDNPEVYQLLIGLRSHIKEEWAAYVNRAGSRRKKVTEHTQVTTADDPFVDSTPDDEDDD